MSIPEGLKFTKEHEWARAEGDLVVIGISDHAQEQLGDIVYVELPAVGSEIKRDETFGTVESVKAVSDLFAPVTGTITAVNETLTDHPETVNSDPYGAAWLVKVKVADAGELDQMMGAADYEAFLGSQG